MPRKSKVKYDPQGEVLYISHPDWDFMATASLRPDYADEIQSVSWSKNGDYLYSSTFECYLHVYIMKKWYGEDFYDTMKANDYVVDHMDNNGYNCCIENLCFLASDENKAKGMTVDKLSREKTHIALSLFKDFNTKHIQMTIFFNYPAVARISGLDSPAVIDLAYLFYDCEYEMVINDARMILYDYRREYVFEPEKLHDADFHIEGSFGIPASIDWYNKYIEGGHGHTVAFIHKTAYIKGWRVEDQKQFFYLRGIPQK